ncbi:MAG: DUF512 domain-containing protein [Lachnospiraceae bacterium]|nr:DUF512 domain-containing protein [Lachnospiraceae bacterium]
MFNFFKKKTTEYIDTKDFKEITGVKSGSIADQLKIKPGYFLCEINGQIIKDVIDYRFYCKSEQLTVLFMDLKKRLFEIEIIKDEDEDLGIAFKEDLMDCYRSCRNKCIFCFIDQLPKGMRDTLYFKDDDSRMSFLQGNYITLTNLSDADAKRIVDYKLSPVNISIHTMNPELRKKMLNNRFAGESLRFVKYFAENGIRINGQIVLCKGINDGDELEYSLQELLKYGDSLESVSIVPSGLTKHREGLYQLEPFGEEDAKKVIKQILLWQEMFLYNYKRRIVYPSDEFYLLANLPLPDEDSYDGYPQLENGVGVLRNMIEEVKLALPLFEGDNKERDVAIATGYAAYDTICMLSELVKEKYPKMNVDIYKIHNDFFGEHITVAGLITGQDLKAQIGDKVKGRTLLLTETMFRDCEDSFADNSIMIMHEDRVLLDDISLYELEKALQTKALIVKSDGYAFVEALVNYSNY